MPLSSSDPIVPYSPSAPTTGFATNTGAQAGFFGSATPEPLIFAGFGSHYADDVRAGLDPNGAGKKLKPPHVPTFATRSDFLLRFDRQDREEFLKLRNMLIAAGVVPPSADPAQVRSAFTGILGAVEDSTAAGANISPMGFIKNLIRMNGFDPSKVTAAEDFSIGTLAGDLDPNRTTTQVSKSVNDLTEGQSWSVLRSTISQMLGHDPSDQELRDYTYKMSQLAAQNPSISKTITKYQNGEPVSQSTHTTGGFTMDDAQQAAYERAQNDPDYAEYQSATTYYNAALSALGAIGQT